MAADLSIVIVNYNTRESLRRTLESIARERGDLVIETIVVDNGSRDGSAAMVRESFPWAIAHEPGGNVWFSGGNNVGTRLATGEHVMLLNPDTVVQPGMFESLLGTLRSHSNIGAVTPRMRFPDGSPQRTASRLPTYLDLILGYTLIGALLPFWRESRRRMMWYDVWERDSTRAVGVIPGSCMVGRRDLFTELGPFDTAMKLYFVEDDVCRRMQARGLEVHFVADALLLHEEHASVRQTQRTASQIYFDDLIAYTRKTHGTIAAFVLQTLVAPTRVLMDLAQRARGEQQIQDTPAKDTR